MQCLQLAECLDRVVDVLKRFCLLDQRAFCLQILLEIQVAKLFVHLQMIVIFLADRLEFFPDIVLGRRGDILDGAEILLEFLELGEFHVDVVDIAGDATHLVQNSLFLIEIGKTSGFVGRQISLTALLEPAVELTELIFDHIGLRYKSLRGVACLDIFVELIHALTAAQGVKRLLHRRHFAMALHLVVCQYLLQRRQQLLLAHAVHIALRFLFLTRRLQLIRCLRQCFRR